MPDKTKSLKGYLHFKIGFYLFKLISNYKIRHFPFFLSPNDDIYSKMFILVSVKL